MEVIAIIVEHTVGGVPDITVDQVGFALRAAGFIDAKVHAILVGDDVRNHAELVALKWGIQTTSVRVPGMRHYQWDVCLDALDFVLRQMPITGVILGQTPYGMEIAPALAIRLGGSCVSGVNFVEYDSGQFVFHRALFGGKISARITFGMSPWVVTIQPGVFNSSAPEDCEKASINWKEVPVKPSRIRFIDTERVSGGDVKLQQAKVVIAGGRGIGKRDNMKLLHELAAVIPGSVVGASRPICDAGWLDYNRQIGLTGSTIRPKLYIACGISGAFQHVVGMRESEFVVAINKDPNAAIFNHADVAIVADLVDLLPILTDKLKCMVREKGLQENRSTKSTRRDADLDESTSSLR